MKAASTLLKILFTSLIFTASTLAADISVASANNCAIPLDVMRGSSETFEGRVTSALARDEDGTVVYTLDAVEGGPGLPGDLVVVAVPNDGVSGASFRVGQHYWFLPDTVDGNEARVEVCKFGPVEASIYIPPVFERSKDLPLELPSSADDPYAAIELLFTGTIASASLGDSQMIEYTVKDVFSHHGDVSPQLVLPVQISEGVFLVGERAWFAPVEVQNGRGTVPDTHFGDAKTIPHMEEAFGLVGADPVSFPASTIAEIELAPLPSEPASAVPEVDDGPSFVLFVGISLVLGGALAVVLIRRRVRS